MVQAFKECCHLFCIPAQPPDRTAHDTAKYNCFPTSLLLPLCPRIFPLFCSLLQMFILKIYFSLGLKQCLHLKFSFTKQENILLEWNSIKEKWFSVCLEGWPRQDLICYVRLESGLIRRDEKGCLIKFTFHFLTWHQSPVTHGIDGNAANNFCQNLVLETDWGMRRQKREEKMTIWFVFILWFQWWKQIHCGWRTWELAASVLERASVLCQWETWGRRLGTDVIHSPIGDSHAVRGESMGWMRSLSFWGLEVIHVLWKSDQKPSKDRLQRQKETEFHSPLHFFFFLQWNHSVCISFLSLSDKLPET